MLGVSMARVRGDTSSSAPFWNSVLTANDVTSIAFSELARTGRNATRSVRTLANMAATIAIRASAIHGSGLSWSTKIV
jgi:hypothetical protein